ncbi:protein MOS2 [Selaginella moellendorffii]|uniref:protein MOS2 n=1 Tax=Selaginella moellendorffii TaxID=88036 RepID=UPI000D1C4562|nr:protein MOS2 [Selaginella moellendorffii]|eukprot:XP_024526719.1 protein MOS2 [Selaginella moellendorffii]
MGMEVAESGFAAASHESLATANGTATTANGTVRFSISSRKRQRVIGTSNSSDREHEAVEFVRSVDEIGIQVVGEPSSSGAAMVIPRLENSWKPEKRMKNLMSAPEDSVQEFVGEVLPAGPVDGVQYGLSVRSSKAGGGSVKTDIMEARELRAKLDKEALVDHLEFLPESASLAAYDAMPVEKFGQALLLGMGWRDGRGIGRRATEDVKATEFVRRPERLGLGAVPAPKEEKKKKVIKPGESREAKPDLVAPVGPDGKVRHRVEIGEKLVERAKRGVYGGKVMTIVSGRHAGLRGEVLGRKDKVANPGEVVGVKLAGSGETVEVDAKNLADVGSVEEENAMKRLKELRIQRGDGGGDDERARPWLRSQIRVRVVSKRFQGGRLYLKKGRVIDVVAPTVCHIVLDESGDLVEEVKQEYLETAIPKPGGRVIVVGGKLRGSIGKLLERDSKKQVAVVQMEESFEMATLDLDHLAEFTGDGA